MTPRILIVAGSDSGGGAGIQADIKTVTMLGGHAMTAITAITAQNTLGVQAVHAVPADMVVAQMRSCIDDIGVDAVKIGMIGSAPTAHAVADVLEALDGVPIVFDPVMIATSGSVLADADTIAAFDRLMRIATLVTPNVPELAALTRADVSDPAARDAAARTLVAATGTAVLAKGGDAPGEAQVTDLLALPDDQARIWTSPRIDTTDTHGTGCTLASAIADGLGRGRDLPDAIDRARTFVRVAMRSAPGLGGGHGPLGHQAVRLDVDLGAPVLNQVTLAAVDHAASAAFYERLSLRGIVDAAPRYARFEGAGGATLSIYAAERGAPAVVYLECADLDAVVTDLRGAGHAVGDPVAQSWGWREARLADPAGNPICLYQAGEMRRFPPWRVG